MSANLRVDSSSCSSAAQIEAVLGGLQTLLQDEIRQIQPIAAPEEPDALPRLQAVAKHFPSFFGLLVEPWLEEIAEEPVRQILEECARLHLYARILDDALDENQPVHRCNLLRAQPMFWRATHRLAVQAPELERETTALITETVQAVLHDDDSPQALCWGPKNHHLLLAPLLLSRNSPAYQACRAGLSALIALVQAGDEWRQGVLHRDSVQGDFLAQIPALVDTRHLMTLRTHGWVSAAERMVLEARQLITVLQ